MRFFKLSALLLILFAVVLGSVACDGSDIAQTTGNIQTESQTETVTESQSDIVTESQSDTVTESHTDGESESEPSRVPGLCYHVDADNNKTCDDCGVYVIVCIDFYAINDLHGKLFDSDSQPGVDNLTTYLKNAQSTDDHVIILSSGDMWQGSSESNFTHGRMMTDWLNHIGAVSMTLGNHEFDWATDYIYENIELAEFPLLALNIVDKNTGKSADYASPSVIVERGDARIGIIGAIGDCHSSISQDKVYDVEFKVEDELTALVKAESDRLRALGCDYIVYSIHDGYGSYTGGVESVNSLSYYDVALSNGYIDLVFEAHSHQSYILRDSHGVYHIQAGGDNTAISHVEIELNIATDKGSVTEIERVRSGVYGSYAADPIISELKEKYKDEIAAADELLGTNDRFRSGDELRQICADLYLDVALKTWGSEYDIVLGGGYMSVRSPYDLYAGEVYYRDLYSIFPFDNALMLCSVSGRDLFNKFVNTSNSNYFVTLSQYGEDTFGALNFSYTQTYYIVTDAYSAYYAPNRLTIIDSYEPDVFARDLLAEYIRQGGMGRPADDNDDAPDQDEPDIEYGTLDAPLTATQVLDACSYLDVSEMSEERFYVRGVVTYIGDTSNVYYTNVYITDGENDLLIYTINMGDGIDRFEVGDTVTAYGYVKNYKGTVEMAANGSEYVYAVRVE